MPGTITRKMIQEAAAWVADGLAMLVDEPKQAGFIVVESYLRLVAAPDPVRWVTFIKALGRLHQRYPNLEMPPFYKVDEKGK